jgi:hypothetical protein
MNRLRSDQADWQCITVMPSNELGDRYETDSISHDEKYLEWKIKGEETGR